jgi:hypothetical protein
LNAVKTALTGRTVLLASDDSVEYERHILAYQTELKPVPQTLTWDRNKRLDGHDVYSITCVAAACAWTANFRVSREPGAIGKCPFKSPITSLADCLDGRYISVSLSI